MKLTYRKVNMHDAMLLWHWVNSKDSLAAKINTNDPIEFEDHVHWLEERLLYGDHYIWIILVSDLPVGQVRLEDKGTSFFIDIFITLENRKLDIAKQAIQYVLDFVAENYKERDIVAVVKRSNLASNRLFQSLNPNTVYDFEGVIEYTWK